jgi:DNA-binding MarR family transcriptional regulator
VTAFEHGVPSTGYLVWQLSLRWQVQLSRALAPVGITHTDYAVLATLHGLSSSGAGPSQRELADASGLEPMYVSKLARALERTGLVERRRHPGDPRAIQLSLTDRGRDAVAAARRIVVDLDQQRLAVLGGASSERTAQLQDALLDLFHHANESDIGPVPSRRSRPALVTEDGR